MSHDAYNKFIKEELERFLKTENTCMAKLTPDQASRFLSKIKNMPSNSKISLFLKGIESEAAAAIPSSRLVGLSGKLGKKLSYFGLALTVYGIYDAMTATDAQAVKNLYNMLEVLPPDRREKILKEIRQNNPDKFR